jgi:hypothetical protein
MLLPREYMLLLQGVNTAGNVVQLANFSEHLLSIFLLKLLLFRRPRHEFQMVLNQL